MTNVIHHIKTNEEMEILKENGLYNLVSVGDYSLNVVKFGKENGKHKIIALAGLGMADCSIAMRQMTKCLEEDNLVVFVDRAGYGLSEDTKNDMTIEYIVEDYRKALRKIMINKEYEENWEEKTSVETIDDIDESTLEKFRKKALNCGRLTDLEYTNIELLKKLNLIANGKLNNAGRFLFSKNNPIVLKMAVFATNEKKTFLDLTRVEGNIFQLIDKAMKYLVENLRWRVELSDDNIHRNEIPEIPIEALREIVVNSFTHARYDVQIQHEIDIFSDRVVISNPGSFANDYDPEDFAMSNMNSFLRNEKIAKVLYLCKDVESFGTGFNKIYSLCKIANVKLGYNKYDEYFNFIFYREDRNVVTNVVLNDNEKLILELLRNDNSLTASKISEMISQSSRNIQRIMDSLRNKGLIERIGSNKSGYWKVK